MSPGLCERLRKVRAARVSRRAPARAARHSPCRRARTTRFTPRVALRSCLAGPTRFPAAGRERDTLSAASDNL